MNKLSNNNLIHNNMEIFFCHKCNDSFVPTEDELQLWEDGVIDRPDYCQDCFDYDESPQFDPDTFSDADPGL